MEHGNFEVVPYAVGIEPRIYTGGWNFNEVRQHLQKSNLRNAYGALAVLKNFVEHGAQYLRPEIEKLETELSLVQLKIWPAIHDYVKAEYENNKPKLLIFRTQRKLHAVHVHFFGVSYYSIPCGRRKETAWFRTREMVEKYKDQAKATGARVLILVPTNE